MKSQKPMGATTSSTSITDTISGSHEFTVSGYSLAKGIGRGKKIVSDTFSVGGYDWAIYFYPDAKNLGDSPKYVSVSIPLASEGFNVRALFEIMLLDQSGNGNHKVHSQSEPYSLKFKGDMWGSDRFFKRTTLEASDYLKDDCLKLKCTVGVVRNRVEIPNQYSVPVPPSDMGQGLKNLLDSGLGCDIEFQVGDETFKAHKLILATRSPVFRSQFFGPLGNLNADKVEVEGVDVSTFKAMLQFIYADRLPSLHEVAGSSSNLTTSIMMQHLLAAADFYDLGRLKQLCEAKLFEEVTADTVATTLSFAEQHHCPQLKAACLKFAVSNFGGECRLSGVMRVRHLLSPEFRLRKLMLNLSIIMFDHALYVRD